MHWNSESTIPKRWSTVIVIVFGLLAQNSSVKAQQRPCTTAEARRADLEAETLRSWKTLYDSYKRYGHCDDAAIAEGYSESVARILVDHWKTLCQFASLARKDAEFSRFVLMHVDGTLNPSDIEKIKANATARCPPGLHAICIRLKTEAESALKEQAPFR